jgi:hypothetical protein
MREAIEAWRDGGVQDLRRWARHSGADGLARLRATAPWTTAIAVGLKPRFPGGLERSGDECLARPIGHHGNPSRPKFRGVRCGNPDPSHRRGPLPAPQGVSQRQALGGRQCCHPLDSGAPFALMLLGDSAPRSESGGPRLYHEALASADGAPILTTRGSVDACLPREDVPLEVLPGERLPSLHRGTSHRGHRVSTAISPSTCHVPGAPSAYPRAFPGACASEPIPLLTSLRWTPPRPAPCRALMRRDAVPGHWLPLRAGAHGSPGDVMGCTLAHAVSGPAGEADRLSCLHVPCGPSPCTDGGVFSLTTIHAGVRLPTPPPLGSAGFAGRFGVTAVRSRFPSWRGSRPRGARASPVPRGERNGPSPTSKLSKTFSAFVPHPECFHHFEGTDHSTAR